MITLRRKQVAEPEPIDRMADDMQKKTRLILILTGISWLSAVGFGLHRLWRYENEPGSAVKAPGRWPASSQIKPDHSHEIGFYPGSRGYPEWPLACIGCGDKKPTRVPPSRLPVAGRQAVRSSPTTAM